MAEQQVSLQPSESKLVSFEAVPHEAKTYQVLVNGLEGSFSVMPALYSETDDLSDVSLVNEGISVPPRSWATVLEVTSGFRLLNGNIFGRRDITDVRITIDGGTPQLIALVGTGVYSIYTVELDYLLLPPIRVDSSFKIEAYNSNSSYGRGCQVMFWARAL